MKSGDEKLEMEEVLVLAEETDDLGKCQKKLIFSRHVAIWLCAVGVGNLR